MKSPSLPDWLPGRLVTVPEAAELLQVSVRQIRRLIADGRLPATRVGRTVRLRPEALAALLDQR
jgi:excisionase family DNA binding protein